jgi:ABC-type spermidine/putrescine transport system permease subunit II
MKTMNYMHKKPIVIPAIIIALSAIALAGVTHTGPTGLYAFTGVGGFVYFLLAFWPEIRTSPRIESLARRRARRRA